MSGHVKVVIANDHILFREGLSLILSREESIKVVGEAVTSVTMVEQFHCSCAAQRLGEVERSMLYCRTEKASSHSNENSD